MITGASSGIGEACARLYAHGGARLLLGARRVDRLQKLAEELRLAGASDVHIQYLDVTDLKSIEPFVGYGQSLWGSVDILINNAGLAAGLDPVEKAKDADWRLMLETNVMGLLRVTQAVIPLMRQAGHGHIVNVGSIAGFYTYANGAMYAGTKHAVKAISGALRLELNGTPIRVTEVDPGMVATEFSFVRLGSKAQADAVYDKMTPLSADDVADCIYFATTRPAHVNIDHIVVMPTDQASVYKVHRKEEESKSNI
jgi:3-hydroxy acid dehydrogenase/malonic semialdehyde reductase